MAQASRLTVITGLSRVAERLVAIGAVLALAGCSAEGRSGGVSGKSPSWPPLELATRSISDSLVLIEGSDSTEQGGGATEFGSDLKLGPSSELTWAIYSLGGFGPEVELESTVIDYSIEIGAPDSGTTLHIALANYTLGRWQWFLVDDSPTQITPSPGYDYVSPAGTVHLACVLSGNGAVTVESLRFNRFGAGTKPPVIRGVERVSGFLGASFTMIADVENAVDATYQWTFSGATPANTSDPAPEVTITSEGGKAASLIVTTNAGSDTYDFATFGVASIDNVWDSAGSDNRMSCQIPVEGPATNNLAWKYFAGGNPASPSEVLTSVVFAEDGTMYFGTKLGVYALNPDGSFVWRFDPGNWIVTTPAIAEDGAIFFGVWTDGHYALEPDGSVRWHDDANIASSSGNPLLGNGAVYFVGGDKLLHGFDELNGDSVISPFQYTDTYNKLSKQASLTSSGVWLFGSDSTVFAYDVVEDTLKWSFPLPGSDLAGGPVLSLDEAVVYIATDIGWVYAIRVSDGEQLQAIDGNVDSIFGWPSPFMTADGVLNVLSADFKLHRLKADSLALLEILSFPTGSESYRYGCADYSGDFFVSSNDEPELFAYDPAGNPIWTYTLGARQQTAATISPVGDLLVGCDDGYVYCFGPGSGGNLQPPYVTGIEQTNFLEGEVVDMSATLVGGGALTYYWDFGGGASPNTSSDPEPQVIIGAQGNYEASLTVSNMWGEHKFGFLLSVLSN